MIILFDVLRWLLQATAKSALAILVVAVAERLIGRRLRARWRYALWLLVLLRLLSPVAPPSAWSVFNLIPIHPAIELQLRGGAGQLLFARPDASPVAPWWIANWQLIAAIWLGGLLVVSVRALLGTVRAYGLVQAAVPIARGEEVAAELRTLLGIRRDVTVVESPLATTPGLHGAFAPLIVLPAGLCDALAPAELQHVIAHELSHLRRHDVALNWLIAAVAAVHWFNPFVHFAVARIEEERELACDEMALASLPDDQRLGYGYTILKLLDRFRTPDAVPAVVGMVSRKDAIRRRLIQIRRGGEAHRFAGPLLVALTVIVLLTLTDARGGTAVGPGTLDTARLRTLSRMEHPVSVDVMNASLDQLLGEVSSKSGLSMTESPDLARSSIRQARFTVHAENVPARALLARELLPFGVVATPGGDGVTITHAPPCIIRRSR